MTILRLFIMLIAFVFSSHLMNDITEKAQAQTPVFDSTFATVNMSAWKSTLPVIIDEGQFTRIDNLNLGLTTLIDSTGDTVGPAWVVVLYDPPCSDMNGDGKAFDISDLTYMIDFLFRQGAEPVCGGE